MIIYFGTSWTKKRYNFTTLFCIHNWNAASSEGDSLFNEMKLNKNSQNIKNINFSGADRERGLLLL